MFCPALGIEVCPQGISFFLVFSYRVCSVCFLGVGKSLQYSGFHEVQGELATEQFFWRKEFLTPLLGITVPEVKGKVADLDRAARLPSCVHPLWLDAVRLKIEHGVDVLPCLSRNPHHIEKCPSTSVIFFTISSAII